MHIGDWTFSKEVRLDSLRVRVSKNLQSSDLTHHREPMIISHFYKMKLTKSLQEFQSLGQSMYTLVTCRLQDGPYHIIIFTLHSHPQQFLSLPSSTFAPGLLKLPLHHMGCKRHARQVIRLERFQSVGEG